KWINASLNLEARPNFYVSKTWASWYPDIRKGINFDQKKTANIQTDYERIRYSATGVFIFYNKKHYIVTARHFLVDPNAAIKDWVFERLFLIENGSTNISSKDKTLDLKSPYIHYLDGYTYGNPKYVLSNVETDVAIISLDDIPVFGKQFVDMLLAKGYRPLHEYDIDHTNTLTEGAAITALGFPSDLSILKDQTKNLDSSIYYWQSPGVSIPSISTGTIRNPQKDSFYFTGNIAIYHGYSGGPVVCKNKLVGINDSYGGNYANTGSSKLNRYVDERSAFIKASIIFALLKKMQKMFPVNINPKPATENSHLVLTSILIGTKLTHLVVDTTDRVKEVQNLK
ncbi:MAG: serine protease, partial [Ferruginibacter sp.]